MATIISTGDPRNRVVSYEVCPVCDAEFETEHGRWAKSETLGDSIHVCRSHKKVLTVAEEIKVQDALKNALEHPRGMIVRNNRLVKKTSLMREMEKHGYA